MGKSRHFIVLILIIIFSGLIQISCDFENLATKDYISVHIINRTGEDILVYTGTYIWFLIIPSATIPSGSSQSVVIERGEVVSFYGKDTGKNYGSRSFYVETQWEVH